MLFEVFLALMLQESQKDQSQRVTKIPEEIKGERSVDTA